MSKYRYALNLQQFAEGDDEFSDDFDSQPEDDEFADEIEMESEDTGTDAEDTTPAEEPEKPAETAQEQKLKLKFNHEEREISLEEATALAQKGMNYEKAVERARVEAAQQARDSYIAEQGYEWNGKLITTEAEYKRAVEEERVYKEAMSMAEREGIPQEFAERMLKLEQREKERNQEVETQRLAQEAKVKEDAQVNDFLDYFQRVNERAFESGKDSIPQEVKDAVDRGDTLKNAYMEYHNNLLINQLRIAKQNETNSKKAPVGSVTAFGGNKTEAEDDFLAGFNST